MQKERAPRLNFIIFVGECYGIFHLEELAFFTGIRVKACNIIMLVK
jgi:hypothetical protein